LRVYRAARGRKNSVPCHYSYPITAIKPKTRLSRSTKRHDDVQQATGAATLREFQRDLRHTLRSMSPLASERDAEPLHVARDPILNCDLFSAAAFAGAYVAGVAMKKTRIPGKWEMIGLYALMIVVLVLCLLVAWYVNKWIMQ
jgi:hypothetical protein